MPLFSLVNTDIHQYPISFSWSYRLYPPPQKNSAVVVIQEFNFHSNKTLFVLGSDTSGKTNIGGSLSPMLPWLQSHLLVIGFILLSLAISPTPRGSVILMIVMFHHIVYRLRHQSNLGVEKKNNPVDVRKKLFFYLDLISSLVVRSKLLLWNQDTCATIWGTGGQHTGQTGAHRVNVSPRWPDERSPIVCCWVKATALTKSPSLALSGRQIAIQHQTHKYPTANRLV